MPNYRMALVLRVMACLLAGASAVSSGETIQSQVSENEETLWNLEHAYWRYVQDNNLAAYLGLWHEGFLGWPSVSAAPVRKEHITDWIASQTSKGLGLKPVEFRPAAIQMTGDVAVTCYWITYKWLDKDAKEAAHTLRITHTWLKNGKDWRIIGGMSMPEPASTQTGTDSTSAPTAQTENNARSESADKTGNAEQEVRQVERDLTEALGRGDLATVDRIYANDYTLTTVDGEFQDKARRIAALKSTDPKKIARNRDDITVRVYGDTAVVTGRTLFKVRSKGEESSESRRFIHVWEKRQGRWQMVASPVTRVAEAP